MKKNIIIVVSFFMSFVHYAQEQPELLTSDASWGKEIIKMPIHFAPQIPYKGVEEIRFSPNWSKQDRNGYWSYVFVWDIDLNEKLTAKDLETYLKYYFDGLMDVVNKEKNKILPKTMALFLPKENTNDTNDFVGKLQIYNSFHTRDIMQLHCTVVQYHCVKEQKSKVVFRFSPKDLEHHIWDELNIIKLKQKPCEE